LKGSNDLDAWVRYAFGGAYDVPWGTCASGVPKFVLFQDGIAVFKKQAGVNYVQIAAYRICTTLSKGLRKPIY
jgi:hypothetical protein